MKTLVLFNNKGGVGKTTLVYHLAHMLARLGHRTLAIDLDPQANLTSAFFDEDRLEEIWKLRQSVFGSLQPRMSGVGDIKTAQPLQVAENLSVIAGDLELSRFEDRLSQSWSNGFQRDESALRDTSAFHRILTDAGEVEGSEIAVIDVGPNLGAINRAALLCADFLLVPLAADLFSLQGLRNLGPTTRQWREDWKRVRDQARDVPVDLPLGILAPIGYVILQHVERLDRPVKHFARWVERIPAVYHREVLAEKVGDPPEGEANPELESVNSAIADPDPACLARLRNYRSLMPMAHSARKPMFDLKPADGAIGSHAALVQRCFRDFRDLTRSVAGRCGLEATSEELRLQGLGFATDGDPGEVHS